MLCLHLPGHEYYDEIKQCFLYAQETTLKLEHSLSSVAKWEAKYLKPFMSKEPKTREESLYYIQCMVLDDDVDEMVYERITPQMMGEITEYIEAPMTATTFGKSNIPQKPSREIITAEIIYYWMIAQNIPLECERWHLNRLMTLIRVCSIKNAPPKKMGKKATMSRNKSLNDARRKAMGTRG